ncbi:MAG: hypothetical protein V4469_03710 [Patescibacteria group bacterium]
MKKKYLISIIILNAIFFGLSTFGEASSYVPLTPIPGLTTGISTGIQTGDSNGTSSLGFAGYLRALYIWGVAAASGLAVVMIMWGGVEYMTSAGGGGVEEAKKRISAAIAGLLLALGSYVILYTINRDLLNLQFTIGKVSATVEGNAAAKYVTIDHDTNTTSSGGAYPGTPGSPFTGGSTGVGGGTLKAQSFPNQSWNDYTMQMVQKYGLDQMNPSDAEKYFPDGQVTAEGWVSLLASMAVTEAGANFNPSPKPFYESDGQVSLGLFGLSTNDSVVQKLGYTTQSSLENPYHSIEAAVITMKNQINSTGSVQGAAGSKHYWGPLYRDEVFQ